MVDLNIDEIEAILIEIIRPDGNTVVTMRRWDGTYLDALFDKNGEITGSDV